MNKVKLIDICDDLSDGLHAAPVFNPQGEYLFVNAINLENGYIIDTGDGKRADYSEYVKYRIDLNDRTILYSIDGTIGKIARYRGEKVILGKGACYIKLKETVNADYIYYLLQSSIFQAYLKSMTTGSTIHHISLETMRNFSFVLPDRVIQDCIAKVLLVIDQKIDLNTRICAELGSMARTLYDYWFVQFDFPDENGKPYRSSGGEMMWCQELGREVPKGWTVVNLGELSKYAERQISGQSVTRDHYVGMDNMLTNMRGIEPSQYDPPQGNTTQFGRNDILLGNIRPYFQKIWLSDMTGACSADVLVISANSNVPPVFLYAALARKEFFDYDTKGSKGTKMPRGDKAHIMNYPIAFDEDTVRRFSSHISEVFDKINRTRRENSQLAHLRDWLLPMLMNGQARVERSICQ